MEEKDVLTETEELELLELEKSSKGKTLIKRLIVGGILLSSLLFAYGAVFFSPLNVKIAGQWTAMESNVYTIENKGKQSQFRINNLQGNPNLTLLIEGDLYAAGSNRYKTKNNHPYLEVTKENLPEDVIEELKNSQEVYEVVKETSDVLLLKYTPKAVTESFPDHQLDSLLYYELQPAYLTGKKSQLKLRNSTFADPTILFDR